MEKWFLGIFIAILVVIIIVSLVLFYFLRKGIRFIKHVATGTMTDEDFERLSTRNYKRKDSGIEFDKDYFRSSQKRQQTSQQTTRTTRTAEGVTIVDRRNQSQPKKKIFTQDEGEYVDFKEMKGEK